MNKVNTVTRINPDGENGQGLTPTVHDPSDTPVDGAQNPMAYVAYSYKDGHFNSGVWACDAGTLKIDNLALHETCFFN